MEDKAIESYNKTLDEIKRVMKYEEELIGIFSQQGLDKIRNAFSTMENQMNLLSQDKEVQVTPEDINIIVTSIDIFLDVAVNKEIKPALRDLSSFYMLLAFNWNQALGKQQNIEEKIQFINRVVKEITTIDDSQLILNNLLERAKRLGEYEPPSFKLSRHYLLSLKEYEKTRTENKLPKRNKNLRYIDFEFLGKRLFVIKDHAVAIKCWKKAYEQGLISQDSLLFHIDGHADLFFNEQNKEKSKGLLNLSDKELDKFIQENLEANNCEFIINAMLSNLIKDEISIHQSEGCDYGKFIKGNKVTTDRFHFLEDAKEHNIYFDNTDNIASIFDTSSLLSEAGIHQDAKELFLSATSLILDLDLDFFIYCHKKHPMERECYARNKRDIEHQLLSESFKEIIEKSKVITIALEPGGCGSKDNCLEVLSLLNESFFKPNGLDLLEKVSNTLLKD